MEEVEQHSAHHDFLAAAGLCNGDVYFCPQDFFFFLGGFVGPSCSALSLSLFALHPE